MAVEAGSQVNMHSNLRGAPLDQEEPMREAGPYSVGEGTFGRMLQRVILN